jgi:Iap family predicted aminopeptidase
MKSIRDHFLWLGVWGLMALTASAQSPLGPQEQVLVEARQVIDTLCSVYLGGRGYVSQGHQRAADYLVARFEAAGLQATGEGFRQLFPIQINLATQAKVHLGADSLRAGRDFIVNRYSGSGQVEGAKLIDLGYALGNIGSLQGKVALFREGFPPEVANDSEQRKAYEDLARSDQRIERLLPAQPAAIVMLQPKLTAGFTRQQYPLPVIEVQADSLPRRARRISLDIRSEITTLTTQNVLGVLPGREQPDSFVVMTAHYDHLGGYEDAVFMGANDNASGIAMMLSMIDYFVAHPPRYSMLFIAFGGEETGLLGSRHYVYEDPRVPLTQMRFLLNLDLMGNGEEGIMAVGGKEFPAAYQRLVSLNDSLAAVPLVRARSNAPNSDHFFFLREGVPGFFVYTLGGPPHYHDVNDNPSTILLSRFAEVRGLMIRFLEGF